MALENHCRNLDLVGSRRRLKSVKVVLDWHSLVLLAESDSTLEG